MTKVSNKEFNLSLPDANGYVPDVSLIGKSFRHKGGKIYTIRGFTWCGDIDAWLILHDREGNPVLCSRTPANFFAPGRYEGPLEYEEPLA